MMRNRDLLKKDIQRAQEIRSRIPAIQKDCDAFEQLAFPGDHRLFDRSAPSWARSPPNPVCDWTAVP